MKLTEDMHMNGPTQVLMDEHRIIEGALIILEGLCDRMEAGELVSPDHLEQIVDFIVSFADKYHHAKEEGILFPAMVSAGFPMKGGPIAVMLAEHELGRGYVRGMIAGVDEYRAGKGHQGFTENARNYIELLRAHITKEDSILYPMAEARLSDDEKDRLFEEFERVKRDQGEIEEEFKRNLEAIARAYDL